jgi:DNA-binding transcriptional LysR family regulator
MRINFELSELQAFVAVAEKSSFRAAAEGLFISQPALSRRIDKLELTLDARLIERTTRHVALTEAGRRFLDHARTAIEELESAMLELSEQALQRSGLVTVACVPSVANHVLPNVLSRFVEQFPRIRVRVLDESAGAVLSNVVSGNADFGLNFIGTQEPGIEFNAIYKEKYILALRRDHRLAKRKSIPWEELVNEKLISVSMSSGNRALLDNALARIKKRPVIFYEANHVAGVLGMAAAGLGVAAIPDSALSAATHPLLVGIPLLKPTVSRTLGLISKKGKRLAPAPAVLYGMLKKMMAAHS